MDKKTMNIKLIDGTDCEVEFSINGVYLPKSVFLFCKSCNLKYPMKETDNWSGKIKQCNSCGENLEIRVPKNDAEFFKIIPLKGHTHKIQKIKEII